MGGNWVDSNDFESRGSCYVHVPDVCPPVDFAQHSRSMTATTTCYETGGATKINGMGSFIMNDTKKQNKCVRRKKNEFRGLLFWEFRSTYLDLHTQQQQQQQFVLLQTRRMIGASDSSVRRNLHFDVAIWYRIISKWKKKAINLRMDGRSVE